MRQVTRKSLDELARVMPVISEENQKMYVGGTSGATGTTGYTGTTGTTGVTGWTGYYDGDYTGYAGGNYGGGDTGGSTSSTGYYGTTGATGSTGYYGSNSTTGTTGYNYGGTGSYTGTAYGDSGCLNNSGAESYSPYSGGGTTFNPYIPNNGSPSNGVIESGSAYTSDNPCPYKVYCIHTASGTWSGGYVQGVGYVASNQKGTANNPYSLQEAIVLMDAGTWKGGYVEGYDYMYPQVDSINKFAGGRDLSRRDLERKLVSGFGDIGLAMLSEKIPLLGTVLSIDSALSGQAIDKVLNYMDTEKIISVYEIVKLETKPTYSNTCDYSISLTYKYFDRTNGNLITEFTVVH